MKFFFPDSQDMVDPSFDFEAETRAEFRMRQRDDLYAHEIFTSPPFDGILVSKAIVDGSVSKPGKYTFAQRHRLRRVGVRQFLRLDDHALGRRIETMGDCGAFSYVGEEEPPYSVDEVIDFYSDCGFDFGISVDHVILAYNPELDSLLPGFEEVTKEHQMRQELTLYLADRFLEECRSRGSSFTPLGVAQGWSPSSYARAVHKLQTMGYDFIALGGMVPLKTPDILACLEAVDTVRSPSTRLHLLGITRCEHVERFQGHGVASLDSTSPFLQAFKDAKNNYHTPHRSYVALRVPQVDGNTKLHSRIRAGQVNQQEARLLEERCLRLLREYDRGKCSVDEVLDALRAYNLVYDGRVDWTTAYRETLIDRPWDACGCDICREVGIDVIIFRGTERNKRRGFHNVHVFYQRLKAELSMEPQVSADAGYGERQIEPKESVE